MKLGKVLENTQIVEVRADMDFDITGVCSDSRKTSAGELFVAVRGYESDGHRFISAAASKGAACVVCEEPPEADIPYVIVRDSRRAMAVIAGNFYGNPASKMKMIGITGTNGKTTTTNLIKQMLESTVGAKVGLIGTNRNMIGSEELETEHTTPDSMELQMLLRRMADAGCEYVVMEVSSHALYLDRVYGIHFAQGIFSNLTEDHLDFHKTMEAYAEAKAKLFSMCDTAIINLDDPHGDMMIKASSGKVFTYSARRDDADITAKNIKLHQDSVSFCALTTGRLEKIRINIPGMFSVYNALAAVSSVVCLGVDIEAACSSLNLCSGVKGRAEVVPTGKDFTVLIDYAHTPDALENILDTVNDFAGNRTILLFGCGGDREKTKRPLMGEIAADKADYVIVTSDNPRTEVPGEIIKDILAGLSDTDTPYEVIENRREAIGRAIEIAEPGDVIILAGKGHETYQIIGHEKRHFDEREIVAEFLAKA
ncbi:MAG: UDP-N-acetylmuramoyl-L-alanyl-D-glutamate--2,6-diaminopimelate ligase [Oscillospiraceae bacterium]